jgi:isoquinoline 1-oxidoreductase beta subunit
MYAANAGFVVHGKTGNKLSYGELAEDASKLPVPTEVKWKDRKDFKLIGKEIKNVANNDIVTGKGIFLVWIFIVKECCMQ